MYDEDERKARNEKIAEAINAKHEAKKAFLDARIREQESADLLYDQKAQIILDMDESGKPTLQGTDAEKESLCLEDGGTGQKGQCRKANRDGKSGDCIRESIGRPRLSLQVGLVN